MPRLIHRILPALLCALTITTCGTAERTPTQTATLPSAPLPQSEDWHTLALDARDLNAITGSRYHHAVQMGSQSRVELGDKGVSALAAGLRSVPFPTTGSSARKPSAFTEDQLIQDGDKFVATIAPQSVSATAGLPQAIFDCTVDPAAPDYSNCAYALFEFTLLNAAFEAIPQSVGVLWSADSAPTEYYIGLSDWDAQRWDWYEGGNDLVVTLNSLYPYYDVNDGTLYVAIVVADNSPRSLELVQVGAVETRATGGASLPPAEAQDFDAPELYFPGKQASFVSSYTLPNVYQRIGYAYDQGETLACTCCAVAAAHNYELTRNYSPLWLPERLGQRSSPKWIFKKSGFGQCLTGRPPEYALDVLYSTGGAVERWSPFNLNCDDDWNTQNTEWDRPYLKIDGWRKIRSKGDSGIDEIKQYLSSWERPVIFLSTVDGALLNGNFTDGHTWDWNDWLPNPINWHTMLIIGWDDSRSAFLVRNSWGVDWGVNGDVWVSYDTFLSDCWIDCFVLWDDYDEAVADWFGVDAFTNAVPPSNFSASEGTLLTEVSLSWDAVPNATDYLIYRDDSDNPIATVPAGTHAYNDSGFSDQFQHTYWIRTRIGTTAGHYSNPRGGWLKKPDKPTIEWIDLYPIGTAKQDAAAIFAVGVYNPSGTGTPSFSWAFPASSIHEASPITTKNASVTFDQPGTHTVTLTVTNTSGFVQRDYTFTVHSVPQYPVAMFSGPSSAKKNSLLDFDASGSTCEAGQSIVEYYWDWQGDGSSDSSSSYPQISHIYTTKGNYNPKVKVRDSRGLYSEWSAASPLEITDYNEIEPNDVAYDPGTQSLVKLKTYKCSIGPHAGSHDGDTNDWFQFSYNPLYTHYVRVEYDPGQITELTLKVWGDSQLIYIQDICTDGLAEVYFPANELTLSYLFVHVDVTGTGGAPYTLKFDRFGEP